jgi:hypothetical protein
MFAGEHDSAQDRVTRTQLDAFVDLLRTATLADLEEQGLARRLLELHEGLSALVAGTAAEPADTDTDSDIETEPPVDLATGSQADLLQFLDRKFGASA